jgi:hypothetical protein
VCEGVNRTALTQIEVQLWAFVNTVNGSEQKFAEVMGPTSLLAGASSLKFVPVKKSFTENCSIVPQLSDGSD